jgi:hypothetical protein
MFSAPFLATLLHRVRAVVRRAVRPGAERARAVPAEAADRPVSPELRGRARAWMRAKLRALSALMRRIEAGARLDQPARALRGARAQAAPCVPADAVAGERLPRGRGWMCAFGPNVGRDGAAFADWLAEPWMRAKVAAAPEHMARAIWPILHATGTARPEWFPTRAEKPLSTSGGTPGWSADIAGSARVAGATEGFCDNTVPDFNSGFVLWSGQGSGGCTPPPTPPTRGGGNGTFARRNGGSRRLGAHDRRSCNWLSLAFPSVQMLPERAASQKPSFANLRRSWANGYLCPFRYVSLTKILL